VKLTVPHMGMLATAYTRVLRNRGVDMLPPPKPSKATLDLGVRHAPEFACLPFKINLGNMMEALDAGATGILMPGGYGPCRFGYYGALQEQILRELGYEFAMASTDNPDSLGNMVRTISSISDIEGKLDGYKVFFLILMRMAALDRAEALYHWTKPREINRGEADHAFTEAVRVVEEADSYGKLLKARRRVRSIFRDVKIDRAFKPLRVGVLGEIFVIIESFASMDLERRLAKMRVEVVRGVWLSDWLNDRFRFKPLRRNQTKLARRLARGYLDFPSGGESIETVGKTLKFSRGGADGVIHVMPFTCMPELVASSVVHRISNERDFPVLELAFDEHISVSNVATRLEAFVDLLERRRSGSARISGN
jgi:predicted nucleotide-binding protein (sugar kinase/HSP70/actin superfamily)